MKLKSLLPSAGLGLFALLINLHCTKITPTDIGTDLLPVVDNVHTFETILRVFSDNYVTNDSSVITYTDDHALGVIEDDPEFGKTEAEIYFGIVPSSTAQYPFGTRDSLVAIDSVVLNLAYTGAFGDSNSVQHFTVSEIIDPDFKDSSGYFISHPGFTTALTELGSASIALNTIDDAKTIIIKSDTQEVSNLLRIPLNPSLGMRFANYDTNTVYTSVNRDSAFQKAFNGLAIRVDAGTPERAALTYYNLNDENTKLTCYYRTRKSTGVDTLSADFSIYVTRKYTSYSANVIHRTPNYGYANLDYTTPVTDAEQIYLQSSPGSYAILNIPGLDTLQNSIIHRAELLFDPIDASGNELFRVPDLLFLDLIDSTGNRFLTIPDDFNFSFNNYTFNSLDFGGYLKYGKYFFNITRYVQNKVTKQGKNYAFRLSAPHTALDYYTYPKESGSIITANRIAFRINAQIAKGRTIVGGGSNPLHPMRLRIIYSKI